MTKQKAETPAGLYRMGPRGADHQRELIAIDPDNENPTARVYFGNGGYIEISLGEDRTLSLRGTDNFGSGSLAMLPACANLVRVAIVREGGR